MFHGSITFTSILEGYIFPPTKCRPNDPSVSELTISSDGATITYVVFVDNVSDEAELFPVAWSEVDRLGNLLSFHFGKPISQAGIKEQALYRFEVDDQGNRIHHIKVTDSLHLFCKGSASIELGSSRLQQLTDAVMGANSPSQSKHKLFRDALASTDPTSQFLGLYQVLASMNGDDQATIDDCIRRIDSNTIYERTKPRKNGGFTWETIYTRLRNEHSHERTGTSLARTRQEIETWLETFTGTVKATIENNS